MLEGARSNAMTVYLHDLEGVLPSQGTVHSKGHEVNGSPHVQDIYVSTSTQSEGGIPDRLD